MVPEGEDGAPALSGALRELCRKTQQPWTDAESARVFLACVWQYHEGPRSDQLGAAVFDKDDDVAVAFVTAASNLRREKSGWVFVGEGWRFVGIVGTASCGSGGGGGGCCRSIEPACLLSGRWQEACLSLLCRASCYGIPKQGLFECKGMAGNIIHAIATTNAIVAGLMTIEALKVRLSTWIASTLHGIRLDEMR